MEKKGKVRTTRCFFNTSSAGKGGMEGPGISKGLFLADQERVDGPEIKKNFLGEGVELTGAYKRDHLHGPDERE